MPNFNKAKQNHFWIGSAYGCLKDLNKCFSVFQFVSLAEVCAVLIFAKLGCAALTMGIYHSKMHGRINQTNHIFERGSNGKNFERCETI